MGVLLYFMTDQEVDRVSGQAGKQECQNKDPNIEMVPWVGR